MTKIFRESFRHLIHRVENRDIGPAGKQQNSEFAKVLADLEKTNKTEDIVKNEADFSPAKSSPLLGEQEFSNMTFREKIGIESPVLGDYDIRSGGYDTVKSIEPPVKTAAPAPVSLSPMIEDPSAPKAPEVIQVLRRTETAQEQTSSLKKQEIISLIGNVGRKHGVDPALSAAIAKAESSFDVSALSKDGHESKGLFQLLDSTGQEMMGKLGVPGGYTPYNPQQNTELGIGYLRSLLDTFSQQTQLTQNLSTHPVNSSIDLEKFAVAAYNAGQGTVARAQEKVFQGGGNPSLYSEIESLLPKETRAYVQRVLTYRTDFSTDFSA